MNKFIAGLALLIFVYSSVFAQQNFKPGLIVKDNSDTVRGFIDYQNWRQNPKEISFKAESGSSIIRYDQNKIRYFQVTNAESYERKIITKDMSPVDIASISYRTRDTSILDTAFLKIVVKGEKVSLYELLDLKYHYYLQESGKDILELHYSVYLDSATASIKKSNGYRAQLEGLAVRYNMMNLTSQIQSASYYGKDLASIVFNLNAGFKVTRIKRVKPTLKVNIFAGLGMDVSNLKFKQTIVPGSVSGTDNQLNLMKFNNALNPSFQIGADLLSGQSFNDWTYRLEIGYAKHAFKGQTTYKDDLDDIYTYTYSLTQTTINPSVSAVYNFGHPQTFRFFAGAGASYNFSSYSKNDYEAPPAQAGASSNDYLTLNRSWFSIFARAGVKVTHSLEIGINAELFGNYIEDIKFKGTTKTYAVQAKFIFGE